jgi:glutaredoxin/glutathione-dependent peroxiredoxin
MAKVGDRIPDVDVRVLNADGAPEVVKTGDVLGSGKVVLFAVPGAFTPGCSKVHLPGYVANADDLKAKGVTTIACVAVNDAWTMGAWAESQGAGDKIVMLADGNGEFTEAMDLVMDGTGIGLGKRSRRYAAVIEDGVITSLDVEEPGKMEVSVCEAVIQKV